MAGPSWITVGWATPPYIPDKRSTKQYVLFLTNVLIVVQNDAYLILGR
jgi:hypothetical protein